MYIELISVTTDLQLYIPLFNQEQLQEVYHSILQFVDKKSDDKIRHARALMSVNKFNFLFRESNFNNFDELCAYLKPLVNQYYEFLILDEKPEKGERKIADE